MRESIGLITAFLIGGIPTGVLLSKAIHKRDVRHFGSKNPGAINVWRTFGLGYGLIVVSLDAGKGYFAAKVIPAFILEDYPSEMSLLLGLAAVTGHIWSPWLRFHGGKGVAAVLGVTIAVFPLSAVACLVIWTVAASVSRYASVSSLVSAACLPVVTRLIYDPSNYEILLTIFIPILLAYTHRSNLSRLRIGTELKIGGRG